VAFIGIALAALEFSPLFGSGPRAAQAAAAPTTPTLSRYQETNPAIAYSGSWRASKFSAASGGREVFAWRSATSATVSFTGTGLSWIATKSPSCGIARVTLDGRTPILVDLYSAGYRHQQRVYSTGTLAAGKHTLKIEWTGKKNARAKNTLVYVDALDVTGSSSVAAGTAAPTTTPTALGATTTTLAPLTTTTAAATTTTTEAPAATTTTVAAATTTTAPAAPAPPAPAPPATYNARDFGARGDGVTDDAGAIQAAVNAARSAGGGTVYLPAGAYRLYAARGIDPDLGANIELFDDVTVTGAGPSATTIVAARDWASAFGAIRRTNVGVRDLTITSAGSEQDGIKFGVVTGALVENVVAHDIYIGVAMYSCTNPVVRNVKTYGCDTGVWIGQGETWPELSVGGLVEDCEGWGSNRVSFRVAGKYSAEQRATGVVLRRNYSHTDGRQDFLFTYAGSVTLEDCRTDVTGIHGIHICGVAGATLTRSTAPFVSTEQNDPYLFANYGGASSDIVMQ
jgi:hypothetical protein